MGKLFQVIGIILYTKILFKLSYYWYSIKIYCCIISACLIYNLGRPVRTILKVSNATAHPERLNYTLICNMHRAIE